MRQRVLLDRRQCLRQRLVAVGVEVGIAGVVVNGVELAELLPRELRDVLGVAPRDVLVGQAGKEGSTDHLLDRRLGRRQSAFHLVEDDPLVTKAARRVGGVLELVANALLLEGVLREAWKEGRVEVDLEEIHEVFCVARAEWVHRPVRAGEGVHESGQRPAGHAEERVAHRESFRASEDDVLEDVRDPAGILRHSWKEDGEGVVVVGALDVNVPCAGVLVLQFQVRALEPFEPFSAKDRVSTDRSDTPRARPGHVEESKSRGGRGVRGYDWK